MFVLWYFFVSSIMLGSFYSVVAAPQYHMDRNAYKTYYHHRISCRDALDACNFFNDGSTMSVSRTEDCLNRVFKEPECNEADEDVSINLQNS